jgi:DUF438 domain-containing protein
MPIHAHTDFDLGNLPLILDQLPAAVTVIDLEGRMLYYNENASQFIDRKPEYLRLDVRECHKLASSKKRIDEMIGEFKSGNREPVTYIAKHYDEPLSVTLVPFIVSGKLAGCIQHVVKTGSTT